MVVKYCFLDDRKMTNVSSTFPPPPSISLDVRRSLYSTLISMFSMKRLHTKGLENPWLLLQSAYQKHLRSSVMLSTERDVLSCRVATLDRHSLMMTILSSIRTFVNRAVTSNNIIYSFGSNTMSLSYQVSTVVQMIKILPN